jgi:NADH-quinone oxidoreductase subunit E
MARFHDMVDEYPNRRSMLMMVLRLVEEEFGCITDEAMRIASELCEMPVAHVQGMVTFYTHFKRPAHGKHRFMVCATLMCALDGHVDAALSQIQAKLGIRPGQRTVDGLFSVEKVECLADCDRPPVVQKDFEHHVKMRGPALDTYLEGLLKAEGKAAVDYRGQQPVEMDLRIETLPEHYTFPVERETGARGFDDKDPFWQPGEGGRNTTVPPALRTPLSAPVVDGVDRANRNGAKPGTQGGHHG